MQKTIAKVEHRDSIPLKSIALKFCDVNFYGFRAREMEEKYFAIKKKHYDENDYLFNHNELQIKEWRNAATDIRNQVRKSKPFYRFCYNKTEKDMLATADKLSDQADQLEKENKELKSKRSFVGYECYRKIEELLNHNGFVLTQTSAIGKECVIETVVWTLEE